MGEEDIKFQTLYDHYKDTFTLQREYLKFRDRLFVYTLLVFTAMFILIIVPVDLSKTVSDIVKEKFKVSASINRDGIYTMLWFALLCLVVRYFQVSISVERQYNYIHKVEKELNAFYDSQGDMFTREGKSYLENFQKFSTLAGYLYIVVFPVLLMVVTSYQLYTEFKGNTSTISLILDTIFCLFILFYTLIYFILLHSRRIRKMRIIAKRRIRKIYRKGALPSSFIDN